MRVRRMLAVLMSLAMVFTMMPMMGGAAYAYDYPEQKSGEITLSGDANELQDQTITFKRMKDSVIDPSKILKTNFTNSDDYTWSIAKAEASATTVTLSKDGEESSEFYDLVKNDAVKINSNNDGTETLLFSVTGSDFGREFNIYTMGETVMPSLGDDETVTLKLGENMTIADLAQVLDDDGNSYILHEYNYLVGDYDRSIVSLKKMTKDGIEAKDDDYVTALNITGEKVGQTEVMVTLCNNDRVPIERIDQVPPHITKRYTINVVKDGEQEPVTEPAPEPKPVKTVSGTATAMMTTKGKTALTLAWSKIEGADGYDIFFSECNHGGKKMVLKNVKSIKGNKIFKWTKSGLKKGTAYKAYVKAYVMQNGKKKYVKSSPVVHAYTGGGNRKHTNAKSVSLNNIKKGKLSLKKGQTFKIKASVRKLNKGKKLMPKSHAATLRYLSSDAKVATVSKSGKVTAKGTGTCTIYVYAHNGVSKKVKVTVS